MKINFKVKQPIEKRKLFCMSCGIEDNVTAIYYLLNNNDIVYVGKSSNVKRRIRSHISHRRFMFDSFKIIKCDKEDLYNMEKEHIKQFRPIYNDQHNDNKTSVSVIHLEEKREDIIKFYNIGMSINKLAKNFKCSAPTMSKHLAAWGVREIQRVNNVIKECEEEEK